MYGDDEAEARAAIEEAIANICGGAALWRERRHERAALTGSIRAPRWRTTRSLLL